MLRCVCTRKKDWIRSRRDPGTYTRQTDRQTSKQVRLTNSEWLRSTLVGAGWPATALTNWYVRRNVHACTRRIEASRIIRDWTCTSLPSLLKDVFAKRWKREYHEFGTVRNCLTIERKTRLFLPRETIKLWQSESGNIFLSFSLSRHFSFSIIRL